MNTMSLTVACLILTGLAAIGFYGANYRLRAAVDDAIAPVQVPERQFGYTLQDLIVFKEKSADRPTSLGQPALQLYHERVLILDVGFAVALCLFCLAFWRLVAQQAPSPFATWLSIIGGTAGLFYGLFDVCEDVVLRALLERGRPISNFESTFASVFTRLKIIAICLSVVGAIVFVLMGYAFKAAFERMRR